MQKMDTWSSFEIVVKWGAIVWHLNLLLLEQAFNW